MIGHDDLKLARSEKMVKYTEAKTTPEIVSQANKIVRGIAKIEVSRQKRDSKE